MDTSIYILYTYEIIGSGPLEKVGLDIQKVEFINWIFGAAYPGAIGIRFQSATGAS